MSQDPTIVLDLLQAFRCSKVMFSGVSLGVFDALAAGPKTLPALAGELHANPDALERLLDACVGLQLFDRDDRGYRNVAGRGEYLCKNSPDRLTGYINYSNDVMWKLWANLEARCARGAIAGNRPMAGTARSSRTSFTTTRPGGNSSWECTASACSAPRRLWPLSTSAATAAWRTSAAPPATWPLPRADVIRT